MLKRADLHVHTRFSEWKHLKLIKPRDSYNEPIDVYRKCKTLGMDYVAITDHDTIDGAIDLLSKHPELERDVIIGEEVETTFPDTGQWIHINVFGVDEAAHADIAHLKGNVHELVPYLKRRGLLYVLNHPFQSYRVQKLAPRYLEEIIELFDLLDGEECEPVQSRIRHLVNERIGQAQERVAELVGFTAQLQEAAARLGVHTPDGACDDQCGCRSDPERSTATTRALIPLASVSESEIACSLHPDLVGGRIDDWNRVLAKAKSRESISTGLRVGFDRNIDLVELAELIDAEQSCCSFFTFGIGVTADRVWLDVTGPEDAQTVITTVFGVAE